MACEFRLAFHFLGISDFVFRVHSGRLEAGRMRAMATPMPRHLIKPRAERRPQRADIGWIFMQGSKAYNSEQRFEEWAERYEAITGQLVTRPIRCYWCRTSIAPSSHLEYFNHNTRKPVCSDYCYGELRQHYD